MRRRTTGILTAGLLFSLGLLTATGVLAAEDKSLYQRLGERPAIAAVVDGMVENILADDRLSWRFKNTDLATYKPTFINFVCMATGGPCEYKGLSMPRAHGRMGVTDADFDITIGHVLAVLDRLGVPAREKAELVMLVGSLRFEVVGQ